MLLLRNEGCRFMQGYLFARPMAAGAVPRYLAATASAAPAAMADA